MKMFLIADHTDTFVGMRLAGIDGVIIHSDEEFKEAFDKAFADPENGIILIMDELYARNSEMIMDRKLNSKTPLIVSVPERGEKAAITSAVSSYIETAVGMKL